MAYREPLIAFQKTKVAIIEEEIDEETDENVLTDIEVDLFQDEQIGWQSNLTREAIEDGTAIHDHVAVDPAAMQMTGMINPLTSSPSTGRQKLEEIRKLLEEEKLLRITTHLGTFENMVMTSLRTQVEPRGLRFQAGFEQVKIVGALKTKEYTGGSSGGTQQSSTGPDKDILVRGKDWLERVNKNTGGTDEEQNADIYDNLLREVTQYESDKDIDRLIELRDEALSEDTIPGVGWKNVDNNQVEKYEKAIADKADEAIKRLKQEGEKESPVPIPGATDGLEGVSFDYVPVTDEDLRKRKADEAARTLIERRYEKDGPALGLKMVRPDTTEGLEKIIVLDRIEAGDDGFMDSVTSDNGYPDAIVSKAADGKKAKEDQRILQLRPYGIDENDEVESLHRFAEGGEAPFDIGETGTFTSKDYECRGTVGNGNIGCLCDGKAPPPDQGLRVPQKNTWAIALKVEEIERKIREDHPGFKLRVTSGYRCRVHNQREEGARFSKHLDGTAADLIGPNGTIEERNIIKKAAEDLGVFTYVESTYRHVHVDLRYQR